MLKTHTQISSYSFVYFLYSRLWLGKQFITLRLVQFMQKLRTSTGYDGSSLFVLPDKRWVLEFIVRMLFICWVRNSHYSTHFIINAWNVNSKTHPRTHTKHSDYITKYSFAVARHLLQLLLASVTAVSGAAWIIYIWIVHLFHSIWLAKTTNTASWTELKFHSLSCAWKCVSLCATVVCECSFGKSTEPLRE